MHNIVASGDRIEWKPEGLAVVEHSPISKCILNKLLLIPNGDDVFELQEFVDLSLTFTRDRASRIVALFKYDHQVLSNCCIIVTLQFQILLWIVEAFKALAICVDISF